LEEDRVLAARVIYPWMVPCEQFYVNMRHFKLCKVAAFAPRLTLTPVPQERPNDDPTPEHKVGKRAAGLAEHFLSILRGVCPIGIRLSRLDPGSCVE
jgi:hypothetical protein